MTIDTQETRHATEPAPAPADPNSGITIVVGILGAVFLILSIVVLQGAYFRAQEHERETKVISQTPQELQELRVSQTEKLQGYKWVDKKNGVVSIPIDRAMEMVVRDAGAKKP